MCIAYTRRDSIYATKQLNDINIIPTITVFQCLNLFLFLILFFFNIVSMGMHTLWLATRLWTAGDEKDFPTSDFSCFAPPIVSTGKTKQLITCK